MFPSNDLVQFVFANYNDTYFCESMLKLDLKQFLWLKLSNKYKDVFFAEPVEKEDPEGFDVKIRSFTHEYQEISLVRRRIRSSHELKKLNDWLKDKLCTPKTAVVFDLVEFCSLYENADTRLDQLKSIAKKAGSKSEHGTLIFTAQPEADRIQNIFLESKVFDALNEESVLCLRKEQCRDMYNVLKAKKKDSCVFFNRITETGIAAILNHITMELPDRFISLKQIEMMSKFLFNYFNNKDVQCKINFPADSELPGYKPEHREIYNKLLKKAEWTRIQNIVKKHNKKEQLIAFFLGNHIVFRKESDMSEGIDYKNGSILKSCIDLLPCKKNDKETELLCNITKALEYPPTCKINHELESRLSTLFNLCSQYKTLNKTYYYSLEAIEFCVRNIFADSNKLEDIKTILECYEEVIKKSAYVEEGINQENIIDTADDISMSLLNMMTDQLKVHKDNLEKLKVVLNTALIKFNMHTNDPNRIKKVFDKLNDIPDNADDISSREVPDKPANKDKVSPPQKKYTYNEKAAISFSPEED